MWSQSRDCKEQDPALRYLCHPTGREAEKACRDVTELENTSIFRLLPCLVLEDRTAHKGSLHDLNQQPAWHAPCAVFSARESSQYLLVHIQAFSLQHQSRGHHSVPFCRENNHGISEHFDRKLHQNQSPVTTLITTTVDLGGLLANQASTFLHHLRMDHQR